MALSIGLNTAVQALRAHQLGVDVASHNIANAQTPGFSRQRLILRPMGVSGTAGMSHSDVLGRAGSGVDAHDVNRVRDVFVDYQLRQMSGTAAQNDTMSTALQQAETVFNDPTDAGMSSLFGTFWASWHDVVNDPESDAARTSLTQTSDTLASRIRNAYSVLDTQRKDLNQQLSGVADQINAGAKEIGALNLQIKEVELNGEMANDLRDRRDVLVDQLSKIANVSATELPDHSVSVYIGSHELVFEDITRDVKVIQDPAQTGMNKLSFAVDDADVVATSGQLKGLLDARDVALPNLLKKLDTLATGLINGVNSLHKAGVGLEGSTGVDFFSGTGAANIAVNAAILADPRKIAAAAGPGTPGDSSVALGIANLQHSQVMAAGAPGAFLVAGETLSANHSTTAVTPVGLSAGAYFLVAGPGNTLELHSGSATGSLVGTATLSDIPAGGSALLQFTSGGNGVATIAVKNSDALNPYTVASQQADLTAAGNNQIEVVEPYDKYYANMVTVLGADVSGAKGLAESAGMISDHLESLRQETQGVNIDEEMTNLSASQKAYEAAARVITTIDEMLDVLINRTGMAGR